MRASPVVGVLLILLVFLAFPIPVQAEKKMTLGWQFETRLTEQGDFYTMPMAGKVLDQEDSSPISEATISIQVNLTLTPLSERAELIPMTYANIAEARLYTNSTGEFQTTILLPAPTIPLTSSTFCTGTEWFPQYYVKVVAQKVGYLPFYQRMFFPVSAGPSANFLVEASPSKLTIAQGRTGFMTLTINANMVFLGHLVNFTAIDLPLGVTVRFDPPSVAISKATLSGPPITVGVTIAVSYGAPVGNHTITILAVPGVIHKVCSQLNITPSLQLHLVLGAAIVLVLGAASIALVASASLRSRRRCDSKLDPSHTSMGVCAVSLGETRWT